MSVSDQITRLQTNRNTIRAKLVDFGLATSSDKLDTLATAIDGIVDQGAIDASVKEGESYTIPAGYHNGSGTVKGVSGGGNYTLQAKTTTPTKAQKSVTPDSGYYGLSSVTVAAIPDIYQDVSSTTATPAQVLSGAVYTAKDGTVTTGTMTNNGKVAAILDATTATSTTTSTSTLYDSGDQYTATTGGWVSSSWDGTSWTADQGGSYGLNGATIGDSSITVKGSYNYSASLTGYSIAGTVNTIDITNVSKITVTMTVTTTGAFGIALTKTKNILAGGTGTIIDKQLTASSSAQTISLDTSSLTGSYYVTVYAAGSSNYYYPEAQITKVALTGTTSGSSTTTTANGTASYTIPAGYHNGQGTVSIVLETKTVTPTTEEQEITPSSGKVLSKVTVAAIPSERSDTSDATATAAQILSGATAYVQGAKVTGTMTNNGAKTATLSTSTTSYTIPAGYHNGSGKVSVTLEEKSATPTTAVQIVSPTSGKVLSKVTVNAIPSDYTTVSDATATAANVLSGKVAYTTSSGKPTKITGTMANNGAISKTINGTTTTSVTIPAGYTSGGTVSLDSTIETALAAI